MTSVQQSHHLVTQSHSSSTGHNLDNNLDALLDDLQTSVSRPGTSLALQTNQNGPLLNGGSHINLPPGATGYREITTTVTQETNGIPMTSREYQIEYLNPANSVTVLDERSSSPAVELLKNADLSGGQNLAYKTETYGYKYSERKTESKSSGQRSELEDNKAYGVDYSPQDKSYSYTKTENYRNENANLNKNLNELDVLLKELNNTQATGPLSTPAGSRRTEHVARTVETRVERSPSGRGYADSPVPKRSSSATREVSYNERNLRPARAQSPGVSPGGTPKVPQRTVDVKKEINTIEQRTHTSRRDSPSNRDRSAELSPILRRRTPSPTSGEFRPATFSSYPLNPEKTQTSSRTVVNKTYNYSSTGRRTPTPTSFDDPQPYRSPSPISFPQKRSPSPVRKSLSRSDSGRNISFQQVVAPHPPLSDPNSPTVITYKYTSHSSQHNRYPGGYDDREPLQPRPFPTPSPVPVGEQSPPKKLDELMASFQDNKRTTYHTEYHSSRDERFRESERREAADLQRSPSFERNIRPTVVKATQVYAPNQQQPVNEVVPPPTPPPQTARPHHQPPARSVAGPPVYYPPGVELFTKKEEAMEQQSAGGKMKGKAKMKYKYESKEKSKEKSSSGMAAVPVCLPVCCAMPCVIM